MAKRTPEEKRKQELIDELIKDYDGPESFWGESGLFADLKRRIVERTLDVEMDDHLSYSKHDPKGKNSGNSRNGRGQKTVVLGTDEVELTPPRDRNGSYDPQLIGKGKKYFAGFDHNIITMYGLTQKRAVKERGRRKKLSAGFAELFSTTKRLIVTTFYRKSLTKYGLILRGKVSS